MIAIRKSDERGVAEFGWLTSRHSFSFGHYYDPAHMGFGDLRVINEDRVRPGRGFDLHGHRDMEILSYVLEGSLEHRDTLGNGAVVRPGEVQRMSAGTGIRHSEYNPSPADPVHFLQIWIVPDRHGLPPGYEQKEFPEAERRGRLRRIASGDGREGSVTIHQDTDVYAASLAPGEAVRLPLRGGRRAWVQVARGSVHVNGVALDAGDGAALTEELAVEVHATTEAEVLVFDLR
jgi:hypothetical protein